MILGTDRSSWKSTALAVTTGLHAQGVRFAIDRASVGTKPDAAFATNRKRSQDAGWQAGAYSFLYGRRLVSPEAQARAFVDRLGATGGLDDCLAAVDLEWVADPANAPKADDGEAFAAEFRKLAPGHPLGIYTARGYLAGMWPDAAATFDYLWDAYWKAGATKDNLPVVSYFGGYSGFGVAPLGQWGPLHVAGTIYDGNGFWGTRDELRALGMSAPDLSLPFECIDGWTAQSYPGHTPGAVDFNFKSGTADLGKPVLAMASGRVISIDRPFGHVRIQHGSQRVSLAHMRNITVSAGQAVQRGQQVAEIGAVYPLPKVISPHLHVHVTDSSDRPVLLRIHGKRVPASTVPSKSGQHAIACGPVTPPQPEEEPVQVKSWAGWTGSIATLVQGTQIENAAGDPITKANKAPPDFPYLGLTPGGRTVVGIETKVGSPDGTLRSIAAYVKPAGVVKVSTPGTDCGPNVKAGRQALKDQIAGIPA